MHNGQDLSPTCGKIDAYDYEQAEQDVINMLIKLGSTDLTDFVIRDAKNIPRHCVLVTNLCDNCCIK